MGYSPWGRKESDMTERLHFHFLSLIIVKYYISTADLNIKHELSHLILPQSCEVRVVLPYVTDKRNEAQRDYVTCLGSQSGAGLTLNLSPQPFMSLWCPVPFPVRWAKWCSADHGLRPVIFTL